MCVCVCVCVCFGFVSVFSEDMFSQEKEKEVRIVCARVFKSLFGVPQRNWQGVSTAA